MGEPFPVMENPGSVVFLFFPVVSELHRTPVGDVTIFSLAEYSIEHSRGTQQADMSAMQRCERPTTNVSLFGKKKTAGLTVGG